MMLAEAVAAGPDSPDGVAIVRSVARELIPRDDRAGVEPTCSPRAAAIERCDAIATVAGKRRERPTTLGSAASQSLAGVRPRRRWRNIAAGGVAALVFAATTTYALSRLTAPPAAIESSESTSSPVRAATAAAPAAEPDRGSAAQPTTPAPREPATKPQDSQQPLPPPRPAAPRPPAPAPSGVGKLAIIVQPWATIRLDGKDAGTTPFLESVPAGRHPLELHNGDTSPPRHELSTTSFMLG